MSARIPEVDLDALMERIRREVAARRSDSRAASPVTEAVESLPLLHLTTAEARLLAARQHSDLAATAPAMGHHRPVLRYPARLAAGFVLYFSKFLTVPQRLFNSAIVDSIDSIVLQLRQFFRVYGHVAPDSPEASVPVHKQVVDLQARQRDLLVEMAAARERLRVAEQRVEASDHAVERLETQLDEHGRALSEISGLGPDSLNSRIERLEGTQAALSAEAEAARESMAAGLSMIDDVAARLDQLVRTTETLDRTLLEMSARIDEDLKPLRTAASDQSTRVAQMERSLHSLEAALPRQEEGLLVLIEELRRSKPPGESPSSAFSDRGYVLFEDRFRGTPEDVRERLKVYLPILREAGVGTSRNPVIDLGCGRGEWLSLLREDGLEGRGVDLNRAMVEICRAQSLQAEVGDALEALRRTPDVSCGAVTAFHLAEHLPHEILARLVDEAARVLKAGGVLILETPNPENVQVGSCTFYLDPTHGRPFPSATLKFLVESRGLTRVEVWPLHPYPESFRLGEGELADRFNEFFYGPRDYAVIGWKP
jgi:SAM-dependent methyltransferase